MNFNITPDSNLSEVLRIDLLPKIDDRGSFLEIWNNDILAKLKIDKFVQANQSTSAKGVIRGMHWQLEPWSQGKLIVCLKGAIHDVALDLRPNSPNFGRHTSLILKDNPTSLIWIPAGFAHGFQSLVNSSVILYFVTSPYKPDFEQCISPIDKDLGIIWPISKKMINKKDLNGVLFKDISKSLMPD